MYQNVEERLVKTFGVVSVATINCLLLLASRICKDVDVWYVCAVSVHHVYGPRG